VKEVLFIVATEKSKSQKCPKWKRTTVKVTKRTSKKVGVNVIHRAALIVPAITAESSNSSQKRGQMWRITCLGAHPVRSLGALKRRSVNR